ncbi:MAG TPA: hypothetical protein VGU61_13165 [Noviherbaspirillum sp.]|jgi:hypothetical protein|uniref:hypothetical protein n=1 Tax=Noviherbaspirillum sp. TaxID=1926288 RepID=UPI002DDD6196|nr:hypothetical protein [Noviherbaspirillum sp.]HEV2611213.1 hypothetical protein [Noviherbaspirillum sp.]
MKSIRVLLLPIMLLALPSIALADPWKDESGHGKGRKHDRREFKEEYWDGNCKVERKLEKNGEYKEERKCKGPHHGHYRQAPVYVPAPPPIVVEPGITVHGTVRIP